MDRTLKVVLGASTYEIKEYTCGQIEDLQSLFEKGEVDLNRHKYRVLAIALGVDHPTMTFDAVRAVRVGTVRRVISLREMARQCLIFGELVEDLSEGAPPGDPPSGEGQGQSTGPT